MVAAWAACSILVAAFTFRVIVPAAREPNTPGFATAYTESRILYERPRELARIYDDAWFQRRVDESLGSKHIQEIARGQPPTMSLLLAPVAWLSPGGARAVWIVSSALLWVAGLALLAAGLGIGRVLGVPAIVWLTALSTAYRPLVENLNRGQGYVLLFFLLSLFVWILLRAPGRRWWLAGFPLALMLLLKSGGLWLWPLLAAARAWRALAGAAAAALAVVLLCWPVIGWEAWRAYLDDAFVWIAREPSNHVTAYQTVRSLAGHLFIHDATWNPHPVANRPLLASLLTWLIVGLIFAVSARFQRLKGERLQERALTLAMMIAPLIAVAPIGEGYHYTLVFPALLTAWWWAIRACVTGRRKLALIVCTLLLCAPQRYYGSPPLQDGWWALLAYPMLYGSVGLWAWLCGALGRLALDRLSEPTAAIHET
jgi:hypothetical protein